MINEFDLIERYFAPLSDTAGLGLKDDASCFSAPAGMDIVVTKDLLVAEIHFHNEDPPSLIAHKALAVNVSDCVAKGAIPKHYWLGLAVPSGVDEVWLEAFAAGLASAQQDFGCVLAGGDTTKIDGPLVLSLTVAGYVPEGKMIRRDGAVPHDDVYVSGVVGDASLGLWCLKNNESRFADLVKSYQMPKPPVALGPKLIDLANSSADVSDGLVADLGHLSSASNVRIKIIEPRIPLSDEARLLLANHPELRTRVWSGGDDYQIVFTASPEKRNDIEKIGNDAEVPISRIGKVETGSGVQLLDNAGEIVQVTSGGYTHF